LNLVEFEVLDAPRGVAEFQKDPRTLATKLAHELPRGDSSSLSAALDIAVLTDESTGPGTWDSLSDSEREMMSAAYRRVLMEIARDFRDETDPRDWRLLSVKEEGESATAVLLNPNDDNLLMKLMLTERNGAWVLTEIVQAETYLHLISETLRPAIKTILDRRQNKLARAQSTSEFVRVLLLTQSDAKAAVALADRFLKDDPKNRGLRHLKAIALAGSEKEAEAIKLWTELAGEEPTFAPALLSLARQYAAAEDKQKLAIEFYTRYGVAEPEDPNTHIALAGLYDGDDDARAETAHKAALKSDPSNIEQFFVFAEFLTIRKRFDEAVALVDEVEKKTSDEEDPFGHLMIHLYYLEDKTIAEALALNQPQRMSKSAQANLYLAYVRLENKGSVQAIPLLRKAAALKKGWSEPYGAMANGYRNLRNWTAALNAANVAIKIDADYSDAHFSRACALARLGRIKEALQSLEKAVELDPELPEGLGDEADLKVLASLPAFKKLLVPRESTK
jgi:tetratricopeptide (TPR) repeat protein